MNAQRHGPSLPLQLTPETAARAAVFIQALTGEADVQTFSKHAADFAQAQLDIERVQSVREVLMATLDLDQPEMRVLKRLAALDRWDATP